MNSDENREHLVEFINIIKYYIPLQRVWMKKGEITMGKFSQTVSEQTFSNLPFLKGNLKEAVAEKGVRFTVTNVRGPVEKDQLDFSRRKMVHTSTYYLDIAFSDVDVTTFGLQADMTLSFAARDAAGNEYEGRNKKIEALREDLEAGETNTVLLTRSMLASGNDWYDLSVA